MSVTIHGHKRGDNTFGVYRHSDGTIKLYKRGLIGEWQQLGSDIQGESSNDKFGESVAISSNGNRIVIGATGDDAGGSNAGHVRVFDWNGSTWTQVGSDIDGEAAGDAFGTSVAISSDGSRIAVGAELHDNDKGTVRVYDYSDSSWSQVGSDIDGVTGDRAGIIAMNSDGSKIVIGATLNDDAGSNAGSVRVYEYSDSSWSQLGSDIDGEAAGDKFGSSVAMSENGNRIIVGSQLNDGGGSNSGHARVFDWNGSAWTQVGSDIDGASADDKVRSVTISSDGSRIAVGSWTASGTGDVAYNNAGHIRVFDYSGSAWSQVGSTIEGVAGNEYEGYFVTMSSDGVRIATGAIGHSSDRGRVRVYDYISSAWTQVGSDIVGSEVDDYLGRSVAISSDGTRIVVGADQNLSGAGYVRVFKEI